MPRKMSFIGGCLAIASLIVGACSDDKKSDTPSDSLATAAMVPAMRSIVALGAATPTNSVDLNACPLGDFDGLVGKAPAGVQAVASPEEQLFTYVYQFEGESPHLQCGRGDLGAYTGETPEVDYHDDLVDLLDDFIVNFEPDKAHRGGTIVRFCTEVIGVGDGAFCEADWYDDNVWIGVFMSGEDQSSELAEQWLIAILDDVVANVPQLAPTLQVAS